MPSAGPDIIVNRQFNRQCGHRCLMGIIGGVLQSARGGEGGCQMATLSIGSAQTSSRVCPVLAVLAGQICRVLVQTPAGIPRTGR